MVIVFSFLTPQQKGKTNMNLRALNVSNERSEWVVIITVFNQVQTSVSYSGISFPQMGENERRRSTTAGSFSNT